MSVIKPAKPILRHQARFNFENEDKLLESVKNTSAMMADGFNSNNSDTWREILDRLKAEFEVRWINPIKNNAQLSDFRLCKTLGAGSFGRVILVKQYTTGEYYAMKLLIKEQVVKTKQVDHTIAEKRILQAVNFPSLVKQYYSFQDATNLYIVLGFESGGEIFTNLRKARRYTEPTAKFYCAQVVLAFEYLHELSIVYRDLKPENMLLCANGYTKVTDFGFAKRLILEQRTYTLCGTPEYLAPELIRHKGYGMSADWWTVGILMYEMTAGNVPFYSKDHSEMYAKIAKGTFRCPDFFTDELSTACHGILQTDVSKRVGCMQDGVNDIKSLAWFKPVDFLGIYHQNVKPPSVPDVKGPGDTSHFSTPKTEEHVHISAKDKYRELFLDF